MKPVWWRVAAPLLVWLVIVLLPRPVGLQLNAWYYLALFCAVIVGLVLEPVPTAAIGFIGVTFATVMGYVYAKPADSIKWALSGFSDGTVWLIFGAFVFSIGYDKTGLGRRIALMLVKWLGGKTLGLGYAIALADLLIAPGTPSNTGRSAGTIYPIIRNIPALYGSEPGPTARKIGAYIMWTAFAATCVTSSMFLTALAPNPLAISLVKQETRLDITWTQWFIGFLPVGAVLIVLLPLLVYLIYPPEIKSSREIPTWAAQQVGKMGPFTWREGAMAVINLLVVGFWIFGQSFFNATTVILIGVCLMLIARVVDWSDVLANTQSWNVLVWFATLVTLADGLGRVGFVTWVAQGVAGLLAGISPIVVMASLVAFFFFIHYMFASLTAHTTAVLPVVLAAGMAIPGLPVKTFALLLCYSLGIMGVITPYATGPGPVYYGSGFITRKEFWLLWLVFGLIFLAALLGIGIPYLTASLAKAAL